MATKKKGKRYWDNKLVGPSVGIINRYVKYRDAVDLDENGKPIAECCTCGKRASGRNLHAGHYIGRSCYSTRYDEQNIHAQCSSCNRKMGVMHTVYREFIIDFRGQDVLEELLEQQKLWQKKEHHSFTVSELEEMYKDYKIQLDDAIKNA